MIIFLPTYKRTSILPHVIKSIINADTNGINERLIILIHNNYPNGINKVESIIDSFRNQQKFKFQIIHRNPTVIPIEGWFDAITEFALEDETVFVIGDDDLMAPWGIVNRYNEINNNKADFLLSDFIQRLYFFDDGNLCWPDFSKIEELNIKLTSFKWEHSPIKHQNTSFISNHCFRNTIKFRNGLKTAFQWCDLQEWSPRIFSTGLLPSYLPYAIQLNEGKVLEIQEYSVIRGSIYEEAIKGDFADGGNVSFYALLAFNTFSNTELFPEITKYKQLNSDFLKTFRIGILESFKSQSISFRNLMDGIRKSGIGAKQLFTFEIINFRSFARLIPFLRGWKLKNIAKSKNLLITTSNFLCELNNLYTQKKKVDL